MSSFCICNAKATHIFFSKNNCELDIVLTRTVNILTTNEHVKLTIRKTFLYNSDPLEPDFYIVKLGFAGVYIIFLVSAQNIDCGYSLELPW